MELLFIAFAGFFGGVVGFNVENCVLPEEKNAAQVEYCEKLASNDMEAESFAWLKGFGATVAVGN